MREREREKREDGRGRESGVGEEICKKLYLRSSFRNIDPRERSYTRWKYDGSLGGVPGDRRAATAVFLFWCISKNLNAPLSARLSYLRSFLPSSASSATRGRRGVLCASARAYPFISAGLLDAVDVRTKDLRSAGRDDAVSFRLDEVEVRGEKE